jgi:hypothetical protein
LIFFLTGVKRRRGKKKVTFKQALITKNCYSIKSSSLSLLKDLTNSLSLSSSSPSATISRTPAPPYMTKSPSSSSSLRLLTLYHYYHHCLYNQYYFHHPHQDLGHHHHRSHLPPRSLHRRDLNHYRLGFKDMVS